VNDDDEYTRSWIRTHSLSFHVIKAYTSDHATTGAGEIGVKERDSVGAKWSNFAQDLD
jgi:hypothetical protein